MRRGPRIEGVYKLCQTYFVQFNVAELLASLRNWRRLLAKPRPAEAKTEESAILLLARNGHHIPGVIGPKCHVHEHASHE